ncbi:lasso peptide biosynthesis PqqD family chaperone [Actinoplanes sp. NPDC023714]|uniref:lasso peptide biosynthesis PqqD family chaperone n=1 Tax=Actinoplanes sp. NPDC023714 TaxID=3154322 RepID=UPI0033E0726F
MSLRLHPDLTTASTDYGTVLLDGRAGRYWQLNPTASVIVQVIADGGDRTLAVDVLCGQFDVDAEHAERDVDALVAELTAAGLVIGS